MNGIDKKSSAGETRSRSVFSREIGLVLLVKLLLIVVIKFVFFNDPVKKSEVVDRMDAAFLSGSTVSDTSSSSGSQRKTHDQ